MGKLKPVKDFIVLRDNAAHIYLYEEIGDVISGFAVAAEIQALRGEVPQINVHINSPGGVIMEGMSIYSAMKEAMKDTTVYTYVDGIAASTAALIAVAGKKVFIEEDIGHLMIHLPWSDGPDPNADPSILEKFTQVITNIIKKRTGWEDEEIRQALEAESWYSAEQAVEKGLADETFELGVPIPDEELQVEDVNNLHKVINKALGSRGQSDDPEEGSGKGGKQKPKNPRSMTTVKNLLNLDPEASEDAVKQAVNKMLEEKQNVTKERDDANQALENTKNELKKKQDELEQIYAQQAEQEVDAEIEKGKFSKDKRDELVKMAKGDLQQFRNIAASIPEPKKGSVMNEIQGGPTGQSEEEEGPWNDPNVKQRMPQANIRELQKDHPDKYEDLRKNDRAVFRALYYNFYKKDPDAAE